MFTYNYMQPKEYHFSLDSIQLAKLVANELRGAKNLKNIRVLDLCAGCGVVGFELAWHLPLLQQLDFMEVQAVYTPYFEQNVMIVNRPELQLHWHLLNYDVLLKKEWKNKFDLIISNPPYFHPEDGMLSPSIFKNRCRFFLDSSFENFIHALANSLAPAGKSYFLMRSLKQHGYDLLANIQALLKETNVSVKKVMPIRGTEVIFLEKDI
jgi:tRNA1Val (adenine37-N6)-methyltransferase